VKQFNAERVIQAAIFILLLLV